MPSKQKEVVKNSKSPHMSPDKKMHFDLDDPDYIRDLQRPAVIKEDLNEMERRKRVQQILESKAFREELEQLILSEKNQGSGADRLKTLEQLSELILPSSPARHPSINAITNANFTYAADEICLQRDAPSNKRIVEMTYALKNVDLMRPPSSIRQHDLSIVFAVFDSRNGFEGLNFISLLHWGLLARFLWLRLT
ncbi:hypothetical protein D918_07193 [Trichuris suis]|nr:hypothetical protein D918_07193 [Trichuris suis]